MLLNETAGGGRRALHFPAKIRMHALDLSFVGGSCVGVTSQTPRAAERSERERKREREHEREREKGSE